MWMVISAILVTLVLTIIAVDFRKPEKTVKHRITHLHGVEATQFKREMGSLLGPAIVSGNRVTPLQNGDEIFPTMLGAIRRARSSITFETYIYWSEKVGDEFADALIERATVRFWSWTASSPSPVGLESRINGAATHRMRIIGAIATSRFRDRLSRSFRLLF